MATVENASLMLTKFTDGGTKHGIVKLVANETIIGVFGNTNKPSPYGGIQSLGFIVMDTTYFE